MSYCPDALPSVTYWECMWNALHRVGWRLSHSAFSDDRTGGIRHLVCARKQEDEVICSAPTMSQAVQMVYSQTRDVTRPGLA
jgi:hypothetical protein